MALDSVVTERFAEADSGGYGSAVTGRVLRAWRVRTRAGRWYRVTEHEAEQPGPRAGAVISEYGHPLTCCCIRARIRRGRCAHTIQIARAIGGRDVVAEMWAAKDGSTTSQES